MRLKLLLISVLMFVLCATMLPLTVAAQPEDVVGQIPIGTPISLLVVGADLATDTVQQTTGVDISQPVQMATDTAIWVVGFGNGGNGGSGGAGGTGGLIG